MTRPLDIRHATVLADCHIHPTRGIDFSAEALGAFFGTELFITLGDMGECAGLDALAKIAPVVGVRGADDEEDARTSPQTRVIDAGGLRIGCVFDPVAQGLVAEKDPLGPSPDGAIERAFGGQLDVLLWASTHIPALERRGKTLWLNPGSATLPDKGSAKSFARLLLEGGRVSGNLVSL